MTKKYVISSYGVQFVAGFSAKDSNKKVPNQYLSHVGMCITVLRTRDILIMVDPGIGT